MAGDHPMHHPFHVHGAGRFLVLSRDGVVEPNLVWRRRRVADGTPRTQPQASALTT
jgi:FtsP/CotA-like multicopper oxidase with cupredoxin domain